MSFANHHGSPWLILKDLYVSLFLRFVSNGSINNIKRFKYYIQICFLLQNVKDFFFLWPNQSLWGINGCLLTRKIVFIETFCWVSCIQSINICVQWILIWKRERKRIIRLCMVKDGSAYFASRFVLPLMWFGDWIGGLEDGGAEKEEGGRGWSQSSFFIFSFFKYININERLRSKIK